MKKIYSLFSILSIGLGFSQTILNQSETASRTVQDPQTVIMLPGFHANSATVSPFIAKIGDNGEGGGTTDSEAGATNPSGTFGNNSFHDTQGNIEVNGGGQLQFTLPIALPPGVKSVAPQINLVYTGGSGNGIAGYGWNLSGITSISRIGKTIEKDGELKGVQLDYSDYYSFNGQRLILKSGEYGKDGAEYVTEKYSNIKIKSVGTITGQVWKGAEYFEVTFEDGSQAWYGASTTGASNARTPIEYNIVKWKDAQGNYITYNYTQSNNVAVISSIQWGGNETQGKAHFNEINFSYESRQLKERSFVSGIEFKQSQILKSITVLNNGNQFKKYTINNVVNANNQYQFVQSITEQNKVDEAANPITFTYQTADTERWKESRIHDSNHNSKGINGDFDGDGKIDLIKRENDTVVLYKDVFGVNTKVNIGSVSTNSTISSAFMIKNSQNQILPRQGFLVFEQPVVSYDLYAKRDLTIKGYSVNDSNQMFLEFEKVLLGDNYDRTSKSGDTSLPPIHPPSGGETGITTYITSTVVDSRDFDLDGDGLSELIIAVKDYTNEEITTYPPNSLPETQYNTYENTRYVITQPYSTDINQQVSYFYSGAKDFFKETTFGDFNGDGKLDYVSGNYYIASFIKGEYGFNSVYESIPTGNLEGVYDRAIAGDFNGDGKTDLMIPKADKTSDWYLYLSTGKGFVKELKTNLSYFSKDQEISNQGVHNTFFESGCAYGTFTYYTYSTDDLDGDGRSEFMALTVTMVNHEWNAHYDNESTNINATIFTTAKSTTSELQFEKQSFVSSNGFRSDSFSSYFSGVVVPFSFTSMYRNGKKAVILGKPENCGKTDCETFIFLEANGFKDISKYSKIKTIAQGGLTTTIDYTELNPTVDANIYGVVKKEAFPYIELDKVSRSYAISQVRQEIIANGENKVRKQDFRYRGLVTHLQGKGMIGFRQTARSSWYTDDFVNTKIWSGAEIDPLNEGLPIKEWSIKTNTESQVFPTDISESNTQLLSFKSTQYKIDKLLNGTIIDINTVSASDKPKIVTAIVPIQSKGKGFLNDITTESTITYGDYYLPHQTVVKTNNDYAINTTTLEYVHNINGTGKDYYVGRPQSKTETVFYSPTSDTKSAKQEYTYNANNLLETLKTYNRDDSGWFLETYTYDDFGNITQKEITNSIDDNTKTDKAEYDAKGRFVLKKTDNLGLETNITYNDWGQVLTQTDTFGNTLTNEYDDWGKLQKSKTNLSGYTSYTYEKFSNGDAVVNEYAPDGGRVITYTNKFGQKYKSAAKAFGQSRFVASEIQFDGLGRKIKESEPYFEDFDGATPSQWNTIEYDDYSRPVKATSFTGKIMQSTYGVRSVKAVETNANNRFKEQKTDPVGKVISTEDLGGIITFKYNAAGENTEADYEGNKVKTSYDAWGNKTRFEDPSNGVYEYKYQGYFGALSESKSPKGKKEYEYNDKGQLIKQKEKSDTGNSTDKVIAFDYNSKGQMISKSGTSLGKPYSSTIAYASNGRLLSSMESSNGKYFIQKDIVYDDKSRVTSYEKSLYSSGVLTKVSIENVYDSWSGELYQVKDKNANKILWELQDANAKGQVTQAKLGGVNVNNSYDNNGFLNSISHVSTSNQATVLQISYSFNAIKNELNSRTTGGDFNITEQFQYDDNNRLYNWTDPVTGAFTQNQKRNEYDKRGRIIKNDQLGTVKFENTQKIYQATGMTLNAEGEQNYNNDLIQSIAYNENNDPVYIDGERGDARFEYGLTNMRQVASYGGNFDPDSDGKFTKYYSEDGSYEVIRNNQTGQEKHLIYIGGTPYESNVVYLKNFQEEHAKFVFLHKDYLGSILAITDEAGNKLEQRHFDAWGNLTHLKIGTNAIITDKNQIRDYLANGNLIIDRGYTSHEHFAEIGIIHMNGRLYDPLLRRFLNADENIQDPNNTQNYNKYGYVLNNPLMYNDPSGEFFFLFLAPLMSTFWATVVTGAIIGAGIGLVTYSLGVAMNGGKWSLGGAFKSMFWGAVSGAVTAGIGNCFSTSASAFTEATKFAKTTLGVLTQAGAHAVAQGTLSLMQGGTFQQAFLSAALGSLAASGFGKLAGDWAGKAGGQIFFGAISGGIGAELTGGNFWQGAVIGGVVAGLNHTMHEIENSNSKVDNPSEISQQKEDIDLAKLFDSALKNKEGTTLKADYLIKKYNLSPKLKDAIKSITVLKGGKVSIDWNNETAINLFSKIDVQDGVLSLKKTFIPNKNNPKIGLNGYIVTGSALKFNNSNTLFIQGSSVFNYYPKTNTVSKNGAGF